MVAGWVLTRKGRLVPFVGAMVVGSATLWAGAQSWWALAPSVLALSVPLWKHLKLKVIVYRSGLTKGTGVLSGARRIDVTMSITRIPL